MFMFRNEVLISKADKARVVELINEANDILEKYPYYKKEFSQDATATTMSVAKGFVKEAKRWCEYLHEME